MASQAETTFGSLEMDERYQKLERYLKLALLRKNKDIHDKIERSIPTWPSISSINADTMDCSSATPFQQGLEIRSEVLASSNNLKSALLRKKTYNKGAIVTSSVKQYNVKQDNHIDQLIMPPPSVNKVYHTPKNMQNKVYVSSECEKPISMLLNSSIQSSAINNSISKDSKIDTTNCISANAYNDKNYLHSSITTSTDLSNHEKVFSGWKVMLNDQHQLIIKGTLECGKVARSKPVIRRYSTTCVESIFKHRYHLQGNITDERNELPDYIRGKFYNGFPDDWENVYQIWRTFVSQGCSVTFRWPTPITDSDDDLKSEITDITYAREPRNKSNTLIRSYETIQPTEQIIQPRSRANNSSEKVEKYHSCTYSSQSYGENPMLMKSFVSDAVRDKSLVAQTSNTSNKENKENTKMNVNQHFSPKTKSKLNDFLREDQLSNIIKNLADRNCSPKYIDRVIEMFHCIDYVISYRTETVCDDNVLSESCKTTKSESISLQQEITMRSKNNETNDNNFKSRTESKNQMHSCDLGYGSIRNDTDPSHLNSSVKNNVKQDYSKREDSDQFESETYAGVPKISIERVFSQAEKARQLLKRKVRKKTTAQPNQQLLNPNAKPELAAIHTVVANAQRKSLLPDESCVSITEEEAEAPENMKTHHAATNVAACRSQDMTFASHQLQKKNSNVHMGTTTVPAPRVDTSFFSKFDFIQPQKTKPNVFTKKQNSRGMQEKEQLQFTDVDYTTDSDVEKNLATATSAQKTSESARAESRLDSRDGVTTIMNAEDSNDLPEKKPRVSRESRKEFINEIPRDEAAITRPKPTIISSIPVNLNLKLTKVDVHKSAKSYYSDVSIIDNEDNKQRANVRLMESEARKKNPAPAPKASTATKLSMVASKSPTKMTVDMKKEKENHATSNVASNIKNKSDSANAVSTKKSETIATKRSKKQQVKDEDNHAKVLTAWMPKVVHHATSKTELGLIFRGKLLNEAGHIVHRNFTTDIVLKRLSPTLIETINHEVYQLLGSLNDNKHVIPKELVKQCRHGCPAKIEQFCLMWKSLQDGKVEEIGSKLHDATMDSLTVPVSSRGRRILPPLCYWEGERVTLKDNIPIYSVGNSKESSLTLLNKSPKKKQKTDSKNTLKNDVTRQKSSPEKRKVASVNKNMTIVIDNITPAESSKAKATDNAKKSRRSTSSGKRRVAQKLEFSSTDSDYEEERRRSPRKRSRNLQSNANGGTKVQSGYTMTLRKRQKMEVNGISHKDTGKYKNDLVYCSPGKKSSGHNMVYAYYQGIPREDFLSDDEISVV